MSITLFSASILSAKEIIILIDSSTKIKKKYTKKSLAKVLKFKKKKKNKEFLRYEDSISLFVMGAAAEDLQSMHFEEFDFEMSKKSRKSLKKKKKATMKMIDKLSGKNISKVIKIPSSDIVFCMDNSGSMYNNGGSNYTIAKDVAHNLVDSIRTKSTKVALVTFGKNAQTIHSLTSSKKKLKKSFKKIKNKQENTNVSAGLKTSCELLRNSTADMKKVILLSDGAPYPNPQRVSIAQAKTCKDMGVEIITVALPGANIKYLDKLSSANFTLDSNSIDLNSVMKSLQGLPSPIIESIYAMSNFFQDYDERSIIIFSSMMQKTDKYNFYTERSLRNKDTIAKFINSLKADNQLPNLKNSQIYIQGTVKSVGDEKNNEIKAFWYAYFKACGAEVISWGSNGIKLNKKK